MTVAEPGWSAEDAGRIPGHPSEEIGGFESGEVAAAVELRPVDDVFQVLDPPELIPVLRTLAERLRKAADAY